MLQIQSHGLDKALANMDARVQRLNDLTPVHRAFASLLRKEITAAFSNSRSPKGENFPPLKPSTLKARKKSKPGPAAQQSGGGLAAMLAASLAVASAGVKPLIDTGRARRSIGVIADRTGIKIFHVGYLRPHVSGGGKDKRHPPKRNPLPLEKESGVLKLIPRLAFELARRTRAYVMTGAL